MFAISRLAIAGFATDLPGAERTSTGIIHNLLAATAFGSIAIAASRLGGGLADSPSWVFAGSWFGWLGALVAITAVALAVAWLAPCILRTYFGLVERCWYAAMLAWLLATAVGLLVG